MIRRVLWRLLLEEGGWSRIWYGLATAMVIAGGGLIYNQVTQPSAPGGTANFWVDGNGGTCTRNSSPAAYNDASACSSLNAAYSASGTACGDLILVKGGSYADQQIDEVSGLSGCDPDVTFRSASGEAVSFNILKFGTVEGAEATNVPDHIVIEGFTLVGGFSTEGDGNNITVQNIEGGSFYIGGGSNISILNSDWGPCYANSGVACQNGGGGGTYHQIVISELGALVNSNTLVEGNHIHDFTYDDPAHFECIRTDGYTSITYRRNHFNNCSLYASTSLGTGTTIIENNWFGTTCNAGQTPTCGRGSSIVNIGDTSGTYILRFNSFAAGEAIADEGSPTGGATNRFVIGNIFGDTSCQTDKATYDYNIYFGTGGATCGSNATYIGTTGPYVNTSGSNAGDYHLSGAAGSTGADNYVPTSVANSGAALDYDSQGRPIDTNRDAGADER